MVTDGERPRVEASITGDLLRCGRERERVERGSEGREAFELFEGLEGFGVEALALALEAPRVPFEEGILRSKERPGSAHKTCAVGLSLQNEIEPPHRSVDTPTRKSISLSSLHGNGIGKTEPKWGDVTGLHGGYQSLGTLLEYYFSNSKYSVLIPINTVGLCK